MARGSRDATRVERKIHFYRVVVLDDPGGTSDYDVRPVHEQLTRLLSSDDRYHISGERVTFCVPESGPPSRLRLFNVRRSDLPQIESHGVLSPLELDSEAGVAEQIHVVFFPDNVIGSEFNFYGPRPNRLAEFLKAKSIGPRIEIHPLVRDDAIRQLDELQELRMARLKVKRSSIDLVRRTDDTLANVLDQLAEVTGTDIDVTMRRTPRTHETLPERIRRAFRDLAGIDGIRSQVGAMKIEGRNPRTDAFELIDLLEQEIVGARQVLRSRERSGVLDSEDAYKQIESAYEELKPEIRRAGTLLPTKD